MRKLVLAAIISALVAVALASAAMAQGSGGVSGPSFYVDGQLYRTVGTPTDLSTTGAPDQSFDTIYQFFGLQPNVNQPPRPSATAASITPFPVMRAIWRPVAALSSTIEPRS